jgi:hypothetical protein
MLQEWGLRKSAHHANRDKREDRPVSADLGGTVSVTSVNKGELSVDHNRRKHSGSSCIHGGAGLAGLPLGVGEAGHRYRHEDVVPADPLFIHEFRMEPEDIPLNHPVRDHLPNLKIR